ncbi:hypothetical protein EV401DRAFT_2007693 [Pisolithus croceorrhizus]|nr:hypothetical protein EV401DRAFT_2007693 [Pisolithus croceorrhizus]
MVESRSRLKQLDKSAGATEEASRLMVHFAVSEGPAIWNLLPRNHNDSIYSFDILLGTRPVFVLELTAPTDLTYKSSRQSADEQIRERLGDLAG